MFQQLKAWAASVAILMLAVFAAVSRAQQTAQAGAGAQPAAVAQPGAAPQSTDPDRLSDSPTEFTSTAHRFRVTPIKGLNRPFSIGFLPDGNLLVTERAGRLRIVRNGVVDPRPIAGVPEVLD